MICYTLSDCVLKNINTDSKKKEIQSDLLGVFPQSNNPHKVVIDRAGKIIDIYSEIAEEAGVHYWLTLMGDFPSSFEPVDVTDIEKATNNEEIFLMVCSQTADKILIAYNHNGWTKKMYTYKRHIYYDDTFIRVLDREETVKLLALTEENAVKQISVYEGELKIQITNNITNNIEGSIVTQGGSITDAKIQ